MPSPLPPSAHSAHGARVTPVMFGQEWTDPNGHTHVADHDGVLLEFLTDGAPVASRFQSAPSAIALAKLLMNSAGQVINNQVNDDGSKPGAMDRLTQFNNAWKDTQPIGGLDRIKRLAPKPSTPLPRTPDGI